MRRVDGVEKARVSLENGMVVLDLKPANGVTLAQLRQIIKNNGFVSKEVHVTAVGEPVTFDGKPGFAVRGTDERLPAAATPVRSDRAWTFTVPPPL